MRKGPSVRLMIKFRVMSLSNGLVSDTPRYITGFEIIYTVIIFVDACSAPFPFPTT